MNGRILPALLLALLAPCAHAGDYLSIASTTSTENSGLYDYLLPLYEKHTGQKFRVIAVGTGQAIRIASRGDADLLIVHHRPSEERFVAEGHGLQRHDLMYNDFVLVGPAEDPARVAGASGLPDALARIIEAKAPFVSRGDDSGTHKREQELWKSARIEVPTPSGHWYWEAGSGMGATLNVAAGRAAYTLSDRATWAAFGNRAGMRILLEGDPMLHNSYGVIAVNPQRHPHVRWQQARRFIDWLLSEAGQAAIAAFRINGEQMFFPNARAAR